MTSRRKAILALGLMASAAAGARVGMPTTKLADQLPPLDLDKAFPVAFGPWKVDANVPVILPAPDVQAKLDKIYNRVLSRTYVNTSSGERIMLSVAYGGDQSDGMSVHLPEVCYPAQGFQVKSRRVSQSDVDGRPIPVVRLITQLGSRHEPVTYWITVGEDVVPTRTSQKLTQIRYGLRGLIPDGMLVRVSSIERDAERAFAVQSAFIADLAHAVPPDVRHRILGAGT